MCPPSAPLTRVPAVACTRPTVRPDNQGPGLRDDGRPALSRLLTSPHHSTPPCLGPTARPSTARVHHLRGPAAPPAEGGHIRSAAVRSRRRPLRLPGVCTEPRYATTCQAPRRGGAPAQANQKPRCLSGGRGALATPLSPGDQAAVVVATACHEGRRLTSIEDNTRGPKGSKKWGAWVRPPNKEGGDMEKGH